MNNNMSQQSQIFFDQNINQNILNNNIGTNFTSPNINHSQFFQQPSNNIQFPISGINFPIQIQGNNGFNYQSQQHSNFPHQINNQLLVNPTIELINKIMSNANSQKPKTDQNIINSEGLEGEKQIIVQYITNNFYFSFQNESFLNDQLQFHNNYNQQQPQQQVLQQQQQQGLQMMNQIQQQELQCVQEQINLQKQEYKPEIFQKIEQEIEPSLQSIQLQNSFQELNKQIQVKAEENVQIMLSNQIFENSKNAFQQEFQEQSNSSTSTDKFNQTQNPKQQNVSISNYKIDSEEALKQQTQKKINLKKKIKRINSNQQFSCEETKNLFVLVIPYLQNIILSRFEEFCRIESFSNTHNKSLQYFNKVLLEQMATLSSEKREKFQKICLDIIDKDFMKYARNHSSFYFQMLSFKYQAALRLVILNPGKFSSIKQAYDVVISQIKESYI